MENNELLLYVDRRIRDHVDQEGKVLYEYVKSIIDGAIFELAHEPKPIQKFIFVEDGTVDTDELIEMLETSNPEIKVVVYRQGGRPPELVEVK